MIIEIAHGSGGVAINTDHVASVVLAPDGKRLACYSDTGYTLIEMGHTLPPGFSTSEETCREVYRLFAEAMGAGPEHGA